MRRAYLLTEVLVILAVFAMISAPLAYLSRTMLSDIPRSYKIYQVNTSLLDVINHLRIDIAESKRIARENGGANESNVLHIYKLQQDVRYIFEDEVVKRAEDAGTELWKVPKAKISFGLWQKDSVAYAVEFKTSIKYKVMGRVENKLANSYVFFTNLLMEQKVK